MTENLSKGRAVARAQFLPMTKSQGLPCAIVVDMSATLIHHGHIRLLKKAAELGDVVVALTSDAEVKSKKGYSPEMFNPYNRAEITTKSPTLSTGSMVTSSCAVLVVETADGKQTPIYKVRGGLITIKGKQYPIKLKDGY